MSSQPLGWNYNPGAWSERLPVLGLAMAGLIVSLAFALWPLPASEEAWFVWPVEWSNVLASAGLAVSAFGFLLQIIGTISGDVCRWRTRPWVVVGCSLNSVWLAAFNLLEAAVALVVLGIWDGPLLAVAFLAVLMIGPVLDELLASLQYLKREQRLQGSGWRSFWGWQENMQMQE